MSTFNLVDRFVRWPLARNLFKLSISDLQREEACGVIIYYNDVAFFRFCLRALTQLAAADELNFQRVKRHVKAIVEFKENTNWAGYFTQVYYDKTERSKREEAGALRYAARLVRFAIELRLLHKFGEAEIVRFTGSRYNRLLRIAVLQELACCHNINCEARHIYVIQRWLRNCARSN